MNEITQEQQDDINSRVEDFKKEYTKLVDKFQVDFISYPQYIPSENGFTTAAQMTIIDKKYLPVKSPIQQ